MTSKAMVSLSPEKIRLWYFRWLELTEIEALSHLREEVILWRQAAESNVTVFVPISDFLALEAADRIAVQNRDF